MTGFPLATTIVFSSLGLVALALGLLARRYSLSSLAIGLTGLLALATASTWITLNWPGAVEQVTENLEKQNASAITALRGAGVDVQKRDGQVKNLKSKHALLATELKTAINSQADAVRKAEREKQRADELKGTLNDESARRTKAEQKLALVHSRFDELSQRAKNKEREAERLGSELATAVAERDKAKAEIGRLERLAKTAIETPKKPDMPTINSHLVRAGLGDRMKNNCYATQPLTARQLVQGLNGSWYILRFKIGGGSLVFADGQFRNRDVEPEIRKCARQLHDEVMAPVLRLAKNTRLFVRGGADARRIVGQVEDPKGLKLSVLPRRADGTYTSTPRRQVMASPLRNKDLPNLRANWLRQIVQPALSASGVNAIGLLGNNPGRRQGRTADLLLYVEW